VALAGERVAIEPLDPELHGDALYAAGHAEPGDPELWTYLPAGPFTPAEWPRWLDRCAAGEDPLFSAVVDTRTGRAAGMCSYLRMTPEHGSIEIGHIWFGAALQRTPQATEAIFLLARHVFDDLGYRRLEWKCDAANARSRRAAERFGFSYEGTFRHHMVVRGRNRDTAWFAIVDDDWPAVSDGFERWLAPANFDAAGNQLAALESLRSR
jgi:RimJ/RimL family protein N-acetyltransferase